MIPGKTYLIAVFLICILFGQSYSQRYPFRNYNVREGLTQSQVQTINQDTLGYLWFGTRDGVAVYDGYRFQSLTNKDGLEANYIITSFLDSKENIWYTHRTKGISRIHSPTRRFNSMQLPPDLADVQVEQILEDSLGQFWFATSGKGVFILRDSTWYSWTTTNGLPANDIRSLSLQGDKIWLATDQGLVVCKAEPEKVDIIWYLNKNSRLRSDDITRVLLDSRNSVWVGTGDRGTIQIDLHGANIRDWKFSYYYRPSSFGSHIIQSLYEDDLHRIWVGTRDGVAIISAGTEANQISYLNEDQGLSYRDVLCLFQDREGSHWIGTNGGGVCQYRDRRFEMISMPEGLPDRTVWSMVEDLNGHVWLGTEKGLAQYIPDKGIVKTYTTRDGMAGDEIITLFQDHSGNIWVSLIKSGLQKFDLKNKRFGKLIPFPEADVLTIAEDKAGLLWLGSYGNGLFSFDPNTGDLKNYQAEQGLISKSIFYLLFDDDGQLWIATAREGVIRYDGKEFKNFTSRDGFSATAVVSLVKDQQGRIWIGTEGFGLYCYENGQFKNYSVDSGLSGNGAYSLVCDDDNNIWQGTRRGIEKFNPVTGKSKLYGQYEGFTAVETNQNAVLKDRNGALWFGTLDGVIKYNPSEDKLNMVKPIVHITNVGLYYNALNDPDRHEFSYRENHLTFDFSGVSFVAPEKIRYKYILEGLDENWSPESAVNNARYTNLSPGIYTFKVLAKNNDGFWSEAPAVYSFEIAAPVWQKAWFYLLVISALAAIVLTLHKRRVHNIEKMNLVLEARVKERTHELLVEKEKSQDAFRAMVDSEARYRTFITYSTEAIWSIEFKTPIGTDLPISEQISMIYSSGSLAECNDAMVRMYGYQSIEEMIGLPVSKLLSGDNPRNIEYLQKFIRSGYRLVDEESYEIDHDGNLRVFLNSLVGIVENNQIRRAWGLQRDITEKKHAEDALKESEERYRRLIELSPDAIIVHSEKRIEYINRAGIKLFGALRQKDLVGKSIFSMIDEEYLPEARSRISKIFSEKKPFRNLEQRMTGLDGSSVDVELIGAPMFFQGEIAGQIVIRDITERKKAENALIEEKERLDVTLRSIADAVITTDVKGRIVLLNQHAREMLGFEEDAGIGFRFHDVVRITGKKGAIEILEEVIRDRQPLSISKDLQLESTSGESYQIEISAAPVIGSDGRLFGVVSAIRDITQRNQMETELAKAQKLESIGVLAGGIAHDFNNFLTAILGNVSLARLHIKDDPKINPILDRAEKAIIQAKELTHQLLTFSKGGAPLKKTTSIVDIIQDSAKFTLRGSDIICEVTSPDDIWNVVVDAGQISQVIQNLILNAVQAMSKGKKVYIRISNQELHDEDFPGLKAGKYVRISIIDEGSGISEKDLNRIFDPYFTTKPSGTGLGLTTTYSIIKRHDGHIQISSQLEKGTTVDLYLPATEMEVSVEKVPEPTIHNGRGRILIMDDDEMVRDLLKQILSHLGYEVDEAENGEKTLEKYVLAMKNGSPVDLIIMDLTIPGGMGGKETIQELKKIDPKVMAIVSSGYSNDPIMANFHDYGFVGVLNKPYNVETLSASLSRFLGTENPA